MEEYSSKELRDFLVDSNVLLAPTVPYSPESNGVAERMNRTIMSKVRAILSDSKIPDFLWESFTATAAYLYNRSSSRPFGGITPSVPISHTIEFQAYVHILKEKQPNKLAHCSKICNLDGYTNVSLIRPVTMSSSHLKGHDFQ